jgi:hypothetical protein
MTRSIITGNKIADNSPSCIEPLFESSPCFRNVEVGQPRAWGRPTSTEYDCELNALRQLLSSVAGDEWPAVRGAPISRRRFDLSSWCNGRGVRAVQ